MALEPKQLEAARLVGKKSYIYFGGARGGGKTYASMGIALYAAMLFPNIKIAFARKTIKELDKELIPRFLNILPSWLYTYYRSEKMLYFDYNNKGSRKGSSINFISFENPEDAQKEQGIERQLYVIDEANNINYDVLTLLRGSLRNTTVPGWKPTMFMTGNPGGISDHFFKKYFVYSDYESWTAEELERKDEYAFVQSYATDNTKLMEQDPGYIDRLAELPKHLREAWLEGKWDTFAGQFFEEWNEAIHVVPPFDIPDSWVKWRSIDLGRGKHPSVCGWFSQDPNDGTLYMYRELSHYGSIQDFIDGVLLLSPPNEKYATTYADPAIFAADNDVYDNSQFFFRSGLPIERANNSRQIGWRNMKEWLHWTAGAEGKTERMPRLRFFSTCSGTVKTLPTLQYTKKAIDDLDTRQQDDFADVVRYATVHLSYGYIYMGAGAYAEGKFASIANNRKGGERKITRDVVALDIAPYYDPFGDTMVFTTDEGMETSVYSYF